MPLWGNQPHGLVHAYIQYHVFPFHEEPRCLGSETPSQQSTMYTFIQIVAMRAVFTSDYVFSRLTFSSIDVRVDRVKSDMFYMVVL